MEVRRATLADFDKIEDLLRCAFIEGFETNPLYQQIGFHEEAARAWVVQMLTNHKHAIFLLEDDGPVGLIAGMVQPYWFAMADTAMQVLLYVMPESRKGRAALKLIRAFEDWGSKWGSVANLSATIENEKVFGLYNRLGYLPVNTRYMKEVM